MAELMSDETGSREPTHGTDPEFPALSSPAKDAFVVARPWGTFHQFVSGLPVTVKVITVQPGHRLSLQRHGHRGEFWHVLDGPVDIQVDDDTFVAGSGEDVWVPQGAVHRMGNSGSEPVRLLEIAYGDFDESDIERLHDDYARTPDDSPSAHQDPPAS